jgi:hypothetical protein
MKLSIVSLSVVLLLLACSGCSDDGDEEARLTALEDYQAIQELVVGVYPRALDEVRYDDYAALFTSDGELIIGDITLKGPAEIEEFLSTPGVWDEVPEPGEEPKPPSPVPTPYKVPHMISNPFYTVTGDTAVGGAYWSEVQMLDEQPLVTWVGHYKDELRKVDGQWKFVRREIIQDVPPRVSLRGVSNSQ